MILNYQTYGNGEKTVVFIHGMASSSRYWSSVLPHLPTDTSSVTIDLLGFGQSPMPTDSEYTYIDHTESLAQTLEDAGVTQPVTIVAHSMGALIALHFAAAYPQKVNKLILCGLPYYPDKSTARKDITQSKKVWELAYYGPTSNALCTVWCRWLRPFSKHFAPLYLKRLPKEVAEDSLLHTWRSYSKSLEHIIENQSVATDLEKIDVPVQFLYGENDTCGTYFEQSGLLQTSSNAKLRMYPELTHQLPLERPDLIVSSL